MSGRLGTGPVAPFGVPLVMPDGYYWYRERTTAPAFGHWKVCEVRNGYVHFFGQVSQPLGNAYLSQYVEFGPRVEGVPVEAET